MTESCSRASLTSGKRGYLEAVQVALRPKDKDVVLGLEEDIAYFVQFSRAVLAQTGPPSLGKSM